MPLFGSGNISGHTHWIIWKSEEYDDFFATELGDEYLRQHNFLGNCHPRRKSEWLCSRYVISAYLNYGLPPDLEQDAHGRNLLNGGQSSRYVSISHSFPWIAVAASSLSCGIDIQQGRIGMEKLASRFIHPDEWKLVSNDDMNTGMHRIWSAKEAMFKAFPGNELAFKTSIRVYRLNEPGEPAGTGDVNNGRQHVKYRLFTLPFSEGSAVLCQPDQDEAIID